MIIHDDMDMDEILENADIIYSQSNRMITIIRQLLDFSGRRKLRYSSTNIRSVILQVFDILYPLAKKNRVTFALTNETEVLIATIDPDQIQQVLVNLVMNSIQAMPGGGKITIDTFKKYIQHPEGNDTVSYIGISVIDTGKGIDPELLKHIFEPFFTTKKVGEGTGLGLSIIQGIVEEHHGWIDVDSQKGKGANFTFYLPVDSETDDHMLNDGLES